MIGFEPGSAAVGSDRSAHCAITAAQFSLFFAFKFVWSDRLGRVLSISVEKMMTHFDSIFCSKKTNHILNEILLKCVKMIQHRRRRRWRRWRRRRCQVKNCLMQLDVWTFGYLKKLFIFRSNRTENECEETIFSRKGIWTVTKNLNKGWLKFK